MHVFPGPVPLCIVMFFRFIKMHVNSKLSYVLSQSQDLQPLETAWPLMPARLLHVRYSHHPSRVRTRGRLPVYRRGPSPC